MYIGIFGDETYEFCYEDVVPYELNTMLISAYVGDEIAGLTAVEFRIEGWPDNPGYPVGEISVQWGTDLVIGTVEHGVALAFSEPVSGPFAELGTIELMSYSDDYIPYNHPLIVSYSLSSYHLLIVDENFESHEAGGGVFTCNCDEPMMCACYATCGWTAAAASSWSAVKSLFR